VTREVKGRRVTLYDISPELWERCKAEAARAGTTVNGWAAEALIEKLEDAIDVREGLEALAEPDESVPWEELKAERKVLSRSSV